LTVAFRVIPKLDIKGPNLVKGVHLEGLRVLGKPEDFARYYYSQGADELIFQDVVASLYGRNSLTEIISKTAKEIFIPLTVGGGIKTVGDISTILRSGADKVSINTEAINNPGLISEASKIFGSSTIVISIEVIKQDNGEYFAFTDNGRNETGKSVIEWAKEVQDLGAGEILLTNVDNEGTGKGINCELVEKIISNVTIPVIAHGGIGSKEDFLECMDIENLSGVSGASIFHYDFIKTNRKLDGYDDEGNTEFLKSQKASSSIDSIGIHDLKHFLMHNKSNLRDLR
jgi:cyclase